jgi:hypothetical protein
MDLASLLKPNIYAAVLDELGLGLNSLETNQESNSDFELLRGWKQTRWIVLSSSFFGIPGILHINSALPNNRLSVLLIVTSLVSMNYWRDAKRGWRRNADLILAKITFCTCGYYGITYVTTMPHILSFYSSIALSLYMYGQSSKCISKNDLDWVKYHFAFHIFLAISAASILEEMARGGIAQDNDFCHIQPYETHTSFLR